MLNHTKILIAFLFVALNSFALEQQQRVPVDERDELSDRGEKDCPICLEEYVQNANICVFVCTHFAHADCSQALSTCHICRANTGQKYNITFSELQTKNHILHWKLRNATEQEMLVFLANLKNNSQLSSSDLKSMINCPDLTQKTPLHYAVIKGWAQFRNALEEAGANVDALDADGKTPCEMAQATSIVELSPPPSSGQALHNHDLPEDGMQQATDFYLQSLLASFGEMSQRQKRLRYDYDVWNYPYDSVTIKEFAHPPAGFNVVPRPNVKYYSIEMKADYSGLSTVHHYAIEYDEHGHELNSEWLRQSPNFDFLWTMPANLGLSQSAAVH